MTGLYRLAARLLLPSVAGELGDEMAATASRLAANARRHGRLAVCRYWCAEFRALTQAASETRAPRKDTPMLSTVGQDIRYGLRLLIRTPSVSLVALVTLALGIGANAAIFSVVDAVLLQPFPYAEADRLYIIQHHELADPSQPESTTPGNYYDLARASTGFEAMAAYSGGVETLTGRGEPVRLSGVRSAGSVLEVLGVQAQAGRIFSAADDAPGTPPIVVISDRLWSTLFQRRADAVGQVLTLAGAPHVIVGVMPAGFSFPDSSIDFWAPAHLSAGLRASRTQYFLEILARLRHGVTEATATAQLDSVMARLRKDFPRENGDLAFDIQTLQDSTVGSVSRQLWVLMAAVGCVLLIACANLANLLLARASARGREIAVRQAVGAARGRLVRQLLVESVLLALLGGAAGLATGSLFLHALVAWLPEGIPRLDKAAVDGRVLLFTFAIAVATGILFGLAPVLQLSRHAPASVLRDDLRTGSRRAPLRAALVVAELAIAVVLLAGAGLLVRSFHRLQHVDPGFTNLDTLTFRVSMEGPRYKKPAARTQFVERVIDRLDSLPGAGGAAASSYAPVVTRGTGAWFNILSRPLPPGKTPPAVPYRVITPGYFRAMGVALVRGRYLVAGDGLDGTPSVVISESTARKFWPTPQSGDPIGTDIYLGAPDDRLFSRATIVGIVKDVELSRFTYHLTDAVYGLHTLMPFWDTFTFTVRASGDPALLSASARAAVRDINPALAVTSVQTMREIVRTSVAPARASMLLLLLFAAVALAMAAIGVFGVMSYAVTLRLREMGIRLALGASPSEVRRMIVFQGLRQAAAGIAIGGAAAVALTRLMSSLLFHVSPGDPLTLVAVAGTLILTAAAACYVPARRATRVNPLVVLRTE